MWRASLPAYGRRSSLLDSRPIAELWPLCEAALAAGGYFRLWPRGRSMLPLLREGLDSVLLAAPTDIRCGDILLVRTPEGKFLLHRAVALTEDTVTLAGDALTTTEGPMPRACILARAVRIYRKERELDARSGRMRRYARRRALRRRLLSPLRHLFGKK